LVRLDLDQHGGRRMLTWIKAGGSLCGHKCASVESVRTGSGQ